MRKPGHSFAKVIRKHLSFRLAGNSTHNYACMQGYDVTLR